MSVLGYRAYVFIEKIMKKRYIFRFMRIKQKNDLTFKMYYFTSHLQITEKLF